MNQINGYIRIDHRMLSPNGPAMTMTHPVGRPGNSAAPLGGGENANSTPSHPGGLRGYCALQPMPKLYGPSLAVLALSILAGIFLGLSGYTFVYANGASYLSNDPAACTNCHIMRDQYDGWLKTAHHAAATCNDCHVPHDLLGKYLTKIDHGYRHSKGFTFQDFHEPIQIKASSLRVVQDNCVRCHQTAVSEQSAHSFRPGEPAQGANCVHCHAGVGHGARH
jgi:cytochrome c nitrite reductase small subunit